MKLDNLDLEIFTRVANDFKVKLITPLRLMGKPSEYLEPPK